jgi:hypothetical protein
MRSPHGVGVTDNERIVLTLEATNDGARRCLGTAREISNCDLSLVSSSAADLINDTLG